MTVVLKGDLPSSIDAVKESWAPRTQAQHRFRTIGIAKASKRSVRVRIVAEVRS